MDVEHAVMTQAGEVHRVVVLGARLVSDVAHVPIAVAVEGVRGEGIVERVRTRGGVQVDHIVRGVVPLVVGLGGAGGRHPLLHGSTRRDGK